MALNLNLSYPGRTDVTDPTGYPNGAFKDESAPAADDGTPVGNAWGNDIWGFLNQLLSSAGISPNNTPDKVGASQYKSALDTLFASLTDARFPTTDEKAAMTNASSPTGANPFATMSDISGITGALSMDSVLWVEDQKTVGSAAQTLSAGQNTRNLTTVVRNTIAGASLNSNQFTLPTGDYFIMARAKMREDNGSGTSGGHSIVSIYDTVAASYLDHDMRDQYGFFSEPTSDDWCSMFAYITVASSRAFELRHYSQFNCWGGYALNIAGFVEKYARMLAFKVG